jgi:hypothetical protein
MSDVNVYDVLSDTIDADGTEESASSVVHQTDEEEEEPGAVESESGYAVLLSAASDDVAEKEEAATTADEAEEGEQKQEQEVEDDIPSLDTGNDVKTPVDLAAHFAKVTSEILQEFGFGKQVRKELLRLSQQLGIYVDRLDVHVRNVAALNLFRVPRPQDWGKVQRLFQAVEDKSDAFVYACVPQRVVPVWESFLSARGYRASYVSCHDSIESDVTFQRWCAKDCPAPPIAKYVAVQIWVILQRMSDHMYMFVRRAEHPQDAPVRIPFCVFDTRIGNIEDNILDVVSTLLGLGQEHTGHMSINYARAMCPGSMQRYTSPLFHLICHLMVHDQKIADEPSAVVLKPNTESWVFRWMTQHQVVKAVEAKKIDVQSSLAFAMFRETANEV